MNTQNQIKISIPELCHEDWNKMTPNEKGSFCSKCCKTVVDFTQKSPEEIKSILLRDSEKKICGRFMSNQLDEPLPQTINLNIPINTLPRQVTPMRAFAIALFIAFGTTLFSCGTYNNATVGEVQIDSTIITGETAPEPHPPMMGAIYVAPDKNQAAEEDTIKKIKPVREMKGEIEATTLPACKPLKDTVIRDIPQIQPKEIMGKVMYIKSEK